MTVTLTMSQLADHLRLERTAIVFDDPRRTILTELMQVGTDFVEDYAPNAPSDVQNLAVVQFAKYIYDGPSASAGGAYAASFVNSGAVHLLNRWRGARASAVHPEVVLTPATPTVSETPIDPITPPVGDAVMRYQGTVDVLGDAPDEATLAAMFNEAVFLPNAFAGLEFIIAHGANLRAHAVAVPATESVTGIIENPETSFQVNVFVFYVEQAEIEIDGVMCRRYITIDSRAFLLANAGPAPYALEVV